MGKTQMVMAAVLLLLSALAVDARLGETEAEIEKRFGKPVASKNEGRTYNAAGGLTVKVIYKQGKSVAEFYSKGHEMSRAMSDELMRRFYDTAKVLFEDDSSVTYATPRGVVAYWDKKKRDLFLVSTD